MQSKKVLVITYYWPPAGGPGVQRWLKFVKYLPDFNIIPIVYCPENPSYPIIDESLIDEVSNDIEVIKKTIREPYGLARIFSKKSANKISSGIIPRVKKQSFIEKLLLYVRGNYFIPDARKNWINPSVKFLTKYLTESGINTIVTTGPPHSLHLIGLNIKNAIGVKWIADFRDPWTTIGYHKELKLTPRAERKHRTLESQVLNSADEIIVTSNNTKTGFSSKTSQPITVITNGYDRHNVTNDQKDENFTFSHIGSLLSERNPQVLWEVISEIISENDDFAEKFQLNLIGVVSEEVLQSIKDHQLDNYLNVVGYVEHKEALAYQMKSQVLLLIEIDSEDTKTIIPGKVFEYLISETPILAVGPSDSDVEKIIKSTNTGYYFTYDAKANLKTQILSLFADYNSQNIEVNAVGIAQYSRKALTEKLSKIINRV
ncbi:glycosyltransferase family 4 protein [Winogradskyella sp. A2]|uniref:glycosyltransferase family 4 protein n=1 Tax=Winogradskyella sp. A2 TaxID=3366944 RepID=UPI00398C32B9